MVLGVCRRVIGDVHLAEDAFQATFLVLARRADAVRPRHVVGSWLYGVAYRTALKARGIAIRRKTREKQVDAMPQPAISPEEAWADLQPVLDSELARLPDKYRIPVILCDLGGRSQRDVARELKLPAATLANRLAAARRLLAKRLTNRGVVLSASAVTAALGWHSATSAVPSTLALTTIHAACAAAAGTPVALPAPVIELSEGIIRMFVLNKLKTVAAGAVTCLLLLMGLSGLADPSLRANPEEKAATPKPASPAKLATKPAGESDDAIFLRRVSMDMRGLPPTSLEFHYFLADKDVKKRTKVVEWMLDEHGAQKITAQCASCHKTGNTAEEVAAFLGMIYRKDHPHAVLEKVKGHGDAYDAFVAQLIASSEPTQKLELEKEKLNVEVSLKLVERVRLRLKSAEDESNRAKSDESRVNLEKARSELAAAQAQLKLAEANLELAESTVRKSLWWLKLQQSKDKEQVQDAINVRIRAFWALQSSSETVSDAEFFRRASLDLRGVLPTRVEQNYFAADKDPKKREKLLALLTKNSGADTPRDKFVNELLADPAIQARWLEIWKQRLTKEQIEKERALLENWIKKPNDRLERLLSELLSSKKTDEQVLESLCLATMARFPTATEKKLILDGLKAQPDRAVAWNGVLQALASTDEAKAHADALAKRGAK
jgi:RNA polymerase sigma factor (sigma-70 family)